jgi:AbrB family looped-hinge helix DNA binding protein
MALEIPVRGKSIISVKGQTVIPKEIREALNLKEGVKLSWTLKDGRLTVFPIPEDPVEALRGILKGHGSYEEWLAQRNEDRRRELKKDEEEARNWRAMSSIRPQ